MSNTSKQNTKNDYSITGIPLQAPEMTTAEIHAIVSPEDGMIVYNTDSHQLLTHSAGVWVATGGSGSFGTVTNVDTGTGLTGGPITAAGIINLADTAVSPGDYTYPSITVDAQGRLTAASNGTNPVLSVSNTDGTINVDNTDPSNLVVGLGDTDVTAGEYTAANITVDTMGRIIAASSGDIGTVDSVIGTDGQINVDSTDAANPVVSLANTDVTAGEYTAANITVDATGRIIAASSGDIGTVDSVIGTDGQINVDSADAANPVVSLANTDVTAGEYTAANITVDTMGRIIAASSGDIGTVDSVIGTDGQINVDSTDAASPVVSLANTDVTAGEYTAANITVDAMGRIIAASSTLVPETITLDSIVTWGANGHLLDNPTTQIDNMGNMTLNGTVTASSFSSVGNLNIAESGKLRITSANQGVVQINANPDLTTQSNVYFSSDLNFPSDSGLPNQVMTTDGAGYLSWQSTVASVNSAANTIVVDSSDPMNINIDLSTTSIVAGAYQNPSSITFDDYGRATAVTSGASTSHGMLVLTSGSGSLSTLLPAGVTTGKVTVIGGGGNGGSATSTTSFGSGGGAGGTAIKYVNDLHNATYTVGNQGQASSFTAPGVSITANQGTNGASSTLPVLGGVGGSATGGSINITGQAGMYGFSTASGAGGNSLFNGGGKAVIASGAGIAAIINSGSGGSGGFKSTTGTGGTGGSGIIIIEY